MSELISLIDKLNIYHSLSLEEYERLIAGRNDEAAAYARTLADRARREFYGNSVFVQHGVEPLHRAPFFNYYCHHGYTRLHGVTSVFYKNKPHPTGCSRSMVLYKSLTLSVGGAPLCVR